MIWTGCKVSKIGSDRSAPNPACYLADSSGFSAAPRRAAQCAGWGKGGKGRVVYATNGTGSALRAWLAVRGPEADPMLCPVGKAGKVTVRRMAGQAVRGILARLADAARVAPFAPHDMRRTFVGDLLDSGADIVTVQGLAGHASPTTTARYDRRGERAKAKASDLRHVPYVPRTA